MSPIRVIRASGTPYQRGLAIGQALADPIRRSAAYNLAHFARRGLDRAAIGALAGPLLEATRRGLPHELAALHGMAEGAGLALLDVLVPNAYEELDPHADPGPWADTAGPIPPGPSRAVERCSALTVVAPGITLLGHNEQWLANEPGDVVLIVELPDDPAEPAVVSPTCASWRPAVGMTSGGHAQGVMSLTATRRSPGHPARASCRAPPWAPATRSMPCAWRHRRSDQAGTRTCTRSPTAARAPSRRRPPGLPWPTGLRSTRTTTWTRSWRRSARRRRPAASRATHGSPSWSPRRPPSTSADVMAILADHGSTPSTICLHPDPADGDDAEAVVFAMVCDLEAGRMWIAPGRPCEVPFEAFDAGGPARR